MLKSNVIKTIGNWIIISKSQDNPNNHRYPMRIYLFFLTANKVRDHTSRLVTPKENTTTTPIHLTLDPAIDSRQMIDVITVIVEPVTLTMN